MNKSKGEEIIETLMEQLDPDSERYRILASAKRFKSSWVELGEKLVQVQASDAYRGWGYASFDEYCSREVRIRRPTAEKLTQAYRFLEREEPELLARPTEIRPLPDFRSVDLLRQASENGGLDAGTYRELHSAVMESGLGHTTLARQFRQTTGAQQEPAPEKALKLALQSARRLQCSLASIQDPDPNDQVLLAGLITRLEARMAALQPDVRDDRSTGQER